jgi:hypothetical protein
VRHTKRFVVGCLKFCFGSLFLDFCKLERYDEAISTLHAVVSYRGNKRNRVVWNKNIEACMLRFVELCVQEQNSKKIRLGLHSYRNLAQANKPNSLEKAVTRIIDRSEKTLKYVWFFFFLFFVFGAARAHPVNYVKSHYAIENMRKKHKN